jgi:hypothetical protein
MPFSVFSTAGSPNALVTERYTQNRSARSTTPASVSIRELNMAKNTVLTQPSLGISKIAARLAVGLSAAFLAILFLLHFLEPEFDPTWRMISEYELGRYGWMMTLAFFCWGGSVLALKVALRSSLRTRGGRIGRWWLLVIGVALFGAGIFITDPITNPTTSTANSLHTLSGAIVILTFPIAASLVARSLARNQEWATARRDHHKPGARLPPAAGPLFFPSMGTTIRRSPADRRSTPETAPAAADALPSWSSASAVS